MGCVRVLVIFCFWVSHSALAVDFYRIPIGTTRKYIELTPGLLNYHSHSLEFTKVGDRVKFKNHFPLAEFRGLVKGVPLSLFDKWKSGKMTLEDLNSISHYKLVLDLDLKKLLQAQEPRLSRWKKKMGVEHLELVLGSASIQIKARTLWKKIKPIVPWFPGISLMENKAQVSFFLEVEPEVNKHLLGLRFLKVRLLEHDLTGAFNSILVPKIFLNLEGLPLLGNRSQVRIKDNKLKILLTS
jgi:hypothetical protein